MVRNAPNAISNLKSRVSFFDVMSKKYGLIIQTEFYHKKDMISILLKKIPHLGD